MIRLKDRVPEYGRAFHSTVLKQTRFVSRLACSRSSVSESRTTSGGRAREKLGGFQSPLAPALSPCIALFFARRCFRSLPLIESLEQAISRLEQTPRKCFIFLPVNISLRSGRAINRARVIQTGARERSQSREVRVLYFSLVLGY